MELFASTNLMMEKNRRIYELINEYIKYGNKWENDSKGVKVLHAYKKAKESQNKYKSMDSVKIVS